MLSSQVCTLTALPPHEARQNLKRDIESIEHTDDRSQKLHTQSKLATAAPRRRSEELRHQAALLLHAPKQRYTHVEKHDVPEIRHDREMLVKVHAVGLNPIDWKAPDFGFGLPELPCVSGRDFAGEIIEEPRVSSRFKAGDTVMGISTDYRDSRKSAYQEFAVLPDYNACRLPQRIEPVAAAPLGVAFVAAALSLGICLGVDFSKGRAGFEGPDLIGILKRLDPEVLPSDIRTECTAGIDAGDRPEKGDWIAIWGGSSATGCVAAQLAKLAGLRVIAILDVAKNGRRMLKHGADLLVDRLDTDRAVTIVRGVTDGNLRFGLDTRDKESATLLATALSRHEKAKQAHLVGLTGLPKTPLEGVKYHSVPIKAFHEAPEVGESLMIWLEKLLDAGLLATPDIEIAGGGLQGINDALDRLRNGSVNGPRIVVPLLK